MTVISTEVMVVVFWIACSMLAAIAARSKRAWQYGLALGLLFGPLGVIAALGLDERALCPKCFSRLNVRDGLRRTDGPVMCPYCYVHLEWDRGKPLAREIDVLPGKPSAMEQRTREAQTRAREGRTF
jgi:hypothetical protein